MLEIDRAEGFGAGADQTGADPTRYPPARPILIAYTASIKGRFQIALHSVKRGQSIVLTSVAGGALEPSWLSDGRHIVFTERIGGKTRLVLLDTITQHTSPLHSMDLGSASGADCLP